MDVSELRISSEAVASATGRTWEEWRDWIDEGGGRKLDHRGIVALVRDRHAVPSRRTRALCTSPLL